MTAGFGRRLEPLTHFLPKPLLPTAGGSVVGRTLSSLEKLGCEVAVLNLHHLGDALRAELGKSWFGLPLRYSDEREILGTLGALVPPRRLLGDCDALLLVNGDSLCRWPWKRLLRHHRRRQADATLLLLRREPDEALGGGIGVDPAGRVVQMRDGEPTGTVSRRHVFAGAHVLSPALLERLDEGPGDIVSDLYQPLLAGGGRIESVVTRRRWHDLGTPERYLAAVLDDLPGGWLRRRRSVVSPLARISPGAVVERSLVAADAVLEDGAEVVDSVVFAGARVSSGSRLERVILGPDVLLPPSTRVDGRMITRRLSTHPAGDHETILGDLSYVPLAG